MPDVSRSSITSLKSIRTTGRVALTLIELVVALVLASLLMAALVRITADMARETRQLRDEQTDWVAAGLLEERIRLDLLNARGIRSGSNSITLAGFVSPQQKPGVVQYECVRRGTQDVLIRRVGGQIELCWIGCSRLLFESLEDADPETRSTAAGGLPLAPAALRFALLDENGRVIISAGSTIMKRENVTHCRTGREGYVLIAVLAAIVLMVTVLVGLSRLSLRRGLAAADAERRLQQRMGAFSIEVAMIAQAGRIFDDVEQTLPPGAPFPSTMRSAVTFGGSTYDVLLADEDAKTNLNAIYHAVGADRCRETISRMVGPVVANAVRFLPAAPPSGFPEPQSDEDESPEPERLPAFRSWGEVFDLERLNRSVGDDAALPVATERLTCWGSGAANLKRAPDPVIEAAAGCVLSSAGAKRLVSRYRDNPTVGLTLLIQQEAKTEEERRRLRTMLSEVSTHFSVWIDASTRGRRSQRVFSVTRQLDDGTAVNERFAF